MRNMSPRVFALLSSSICAFLALPLRAEPAQENLLVLDGTISIGCPEANKPVLSQTGAGGIRVTFEGESADEGSFMIYLRKTLTPPRALQTIEFQLQGTEKPMLVEVTTEDKKVAYNHVRPTGDEAIDLTRLNFKGTKEPFAGKVEKISIGVAVPRMAGEHSLDWETLKLGP